MTILSINKYFPLRVLIIVFTISILFMGVLSVNEELHNGLLNGKKFWFYTAIILLSTINAGYLFISDWKISITKADYIFFAFILYIGVQSYLLGLLGKQDVQLLLLLYLCYLNIKILIAKSILVYNGLIITLIFIGLIEAIWGLLQLVGITNSQHKIFLLTGSFPNPGPYSGFLALTLPIAIHFILTSNKMNEKEKNIFTLYSLIHILSYILIAIALFILPMGLSRAACLSGLVGCLWVYIPHIKQSKFLRKNRNKSIIGLLLIMFFLMSMGVGAFFIKKNSADGRLLVWKISMTIIKQQPLFGNGVGSFPGKYGEAQFRYFESGKGTEHEEFVADAPEYAFNEYIQLCCELGLVGLVFFILLIIFLIVTSQQRGLSGSLLSILIFALFSYPFKLLPFCIVFVVLAALLTYNSQNIAVSKRISLSIALVFLGIIGFIFHSRIPEYSQYKKWNGIEVSYNNKNFDIINNYRSLYQAFRDDKDFLFQYGMCLSKRKKYEESNIILKQGLMCSSDPMFLNLMGYNYMKLEMYDNAVKAYEHSMYQVPNRLYPLLLLSRIYEKMGNEVKAKEFAQKLINKKAKIETTATREMRLEMQKYLNNEKE